MLIICANNYVALIVFLIEFSLLVHAIFFLFLYPSYGTFAAQQIKEMWRAKTSKTEYAMKANRRFEKATICGTKEKALILQ